MRGMYVAGIVAVATAGMAAAQYGMSQTTEITDRDDGDTIRTTVGSEIRARLPQYRGDPYRWELRNDPRVQLVAPPTVTTAPGGNRPGGLEERRFRIRVTQPGRFPLIFGLRSTELGPNQVPRQRIVVTVDAVAAREDRPRPIDGPDTVEPLTEADAGRTIDVPVGQRLTIAVPSNNSTGYSWSLEGSTNVAILGDINEQRSRNARIGGGGTSIVRFYVVRRGFPAEIQLRYRPPGGGRAVRTLIYRFRGI